MLVRPVRTAQVAAEFQKHKIWCLTPNEVTGFLFFPWTKPNWSDFNQSKRIESAVACRFIVRQWFVIWLRTSDCRLFKHPRVVPNQDYLYRVLCWQPWDESLTYWVLSRRFHRHRGPNTANFTTILKSNSCSCEGISMEQQLDTFQVLIRWTARRSVQGFNARRR